MNPEDKKKIRILAKQMEGDHVGKMVKAFEQKGTKGLQDYIDTYVKSKKRTL